VGGEHTQFAASLHTLCKVLQAQGRHDQAQSKLEEHLVFLELHCWIEHFQCAEELGFLADAV